VDFFCGLLAGADFLQWAPVLEISFLVGCFGSEFLLVDDDLQRG
jgi:hypothetical protein